MANKNLATYETLDPITITLTPSGVGIAAGAGRSSASIDNTGLRSIWGKLFVKIKIGTAPTASSVVKIYYHEHSDDATTPLIEGDVTNADAALTTEPTNAKLLGELPYPNTANTTITREFDLPSPLPKRFSFSVWNATNQALTGTSTDHALQLQRITPELQ